jgi:hypothetical protein
LFELMLYIENAAEIMKKKIARLLVFWRLRCGVETRRTPG